MIGLHILPDTWFELSSFLFLFLSFVFPFPIHLLLFLALFSPILSYGAPRIDWNGCGCSHYIEYRKSLSLLREESKGGDEDWTPILLCP